MPGVAALWPAEVEAVQVRGSMIWRRNSRLSLATRAFLLSDKGPVEPAVVVSRKPRFEIALGLHFVFD